MLDALTLDQMRTFVAVAEAGSFRAAAGRLSRVQSAVSHAIGNLEAQLGVTLFDRSGHRPTLTPEGQALLADMRAVLLKVDTMRARARGLGEGLELRLAIALDPQFPLGIAAAALKDLHEAYPSVSVRLWTAPLGAAIVALREGRCALAITAAEIPDPRIELEALSFVPRAAVAAATHPLAARSSARGATYGSRTRGPPPDRGPGPVAAHRGARLRRAVSRNLARERQRDEACPDRCRCRLGKPAAMAGRARSGGGSARPDRGRGVRAAGRDVRARLSGAPDGPASRPGRTPASSGVASTCRRIGRHGALA